MSPKLTAIVAGVPALAQALEATGQFAKVAPIASTSELKTMLQSGILSGGTSDKIFIFSDSTVVDTPQTLPFLIGKLTSMRIATVVIGTSPRGRDLIAECPGAGLLEGPLRVNQVLGALAGIEGISGLSPVAANENVAVPLDAAQVASTPFSAQAAPSSAPRAQDPVREVTQSPFTSVAPTFAAPASTSGSSASPFGGSRTSAEPPVDNRGSSPFNSPTAPPAASPFGGGNKGASPFGNVSNQGPSPFGGQVASPFGGDGGPAEQPSPFGGQSHARPQSRTEESSPFGNAPTAQTARFGDRPTEQPSPFGAQRAQESPFGSPQDRSPFSSGPSPSPFGGPVQSASPFGSGTPGAHQGFGGGPRRRLGAPEPEVHRRRGRVITVTAPKGGTGKSTLSLNLAAYLGLRLRGSGRNVCLIDANVQQADTGKYMNVFTPNVEGLLKDPTAIHPDRINQYLLHKADLNMSALLGPATPESANPMFFSGRRYKEILDAIRPNYDYVIIDTPVAELYHDLFREFALPEADFIVVTISPNTTTLIDTDNWLRQVTASRNADGMGIDPNRIGIVLNRAEDGIGLTEDEARHELGEWNWLGSIPETKEWKRCNNKNEIVATKNFDDLNQAFAGVLLRATGDELLRTTAPDLVPERKSGVADFFGRFTKRR